MASSTAPGQSAAPARHLCAGGGTGCRARNRCGNRSCNFRIALAQAGRDRGLGTEALRLIVGHGFEQLGLHRISLKVFAFNPRARRVYEKAGFVVEGVLRDALRYDRAWVDEIVMSLLAPEWKRHHGHPVSVPLSRDDPPAAKGP